MPVPADTRAAVLNPSNLATTKNNSPIPMSVAIAGRLARRRAMSTPGSLSGVPIASPLTCSEGPVGVAEALVPRGAPDRELFSVKAVRSVPVTGPWIPAPARHHRDELPRQIEVT